MNLSNYPWTLIIFIVTQTAGAIWFFSKLSSKVEGMEKKQDELEKENKELKAELKNIRDILIRVEQNTSLLMLGRIKTGRQEAA